MVDRDKFERAFAYVVDREGFYSDDPDDPGNWTGGKKGEGELKGTKYGISAAAYPQLDIKNLSIPEVKSVYRRDYWEKAQCESWPPALSFVVFDCAVNQGVKRAIECLQRAAGVNDDGKIGPHTRAAVARLPEKIAVEYFQAERVLEYTKAAIWAKYGRGWIRRVIGTAMEAA